MEYKMNTLYTIARAHPMDGVIEYLTAFDRFDSLEYAWAKQDRKILEDKSAQLQVDQPGFDYEIVSVSEAEKYEAQP